MSPLAFSLCRCPGDLSTQRLRTLKISSGQMFCAFATTHTSTGHLESPSRLNLRSFASLPPQKFCHPESPFRSCDSQCTRQLNLCGGSSTSSRRSSVSCSSLKQQDAAFHSVASRKEEQTARGGSKLEGCSIPGVLPQEYLNCVDEFSGSADRELLKESYLPSENSETNPPGFKGIFGWLESKLPPRVRGLILLNILTFLYGSNITVVKEAEALLDPFTFSLGRFSIAALAFAPFLRPALEQATVRRAGIELGIWASLAYVTQAVGLLTTDAGRAAFIGTFTVIEVPLIAGLFGTRIPPITWYSAAAAVLGVGLLESAGGSSSMMGDFWTIMSALLFGFHILRSEHHARHVPQDSAISLIALQLLVTAVMSLGWLMSLSQFGLIDSSTLAALSTGDFDTVASWPWLQMAYTGVLSTAFCLWVEVVSLRDVSASEAAMVYTLEPLYGAAFAWFLLGERWGPIGWVGAMLILGGSVTMQLFGWVESPEDDLEEVEIDKSSAAILGALGAAAAIALIMVASGMPSQVMQEPFPDGLLSPEAVAWVPYGEVEIENLATLMRAYAIVKADQPDTGNGKVDDD